MDSGKLYCEHQPVTKISDEPSVCEKVSTIVSMRRARELYTSVWTLRILSARKLKKRESNGMITRDREYIPHSSRHPTPEPGLAKPGVHRLGLVGMRD